MTHDNSDQRAKWGSQMEYYLCTIGYAVGFGSLWRFPYLVYANGGGAFLFPYLVCFFIMGVPIFYLESALGQMFQEGIAKCFEKIRKAFRGIGVAPVIMCYFIATFYNLFLAYGFIFLWDSFSYPLPWKVENPINGKLWDEKYFYNEVLEITDNMLNIGGFNSKVIIGSIVSFIFVYICIIKGIKTSGKVAYVTALAPYVLLFILLLRGLFLDGAIEGIGYLFTVDWSKVWTTEIWFKAASQVLFQLSVGFGTLIAFSSYKHQSEPILHSAIVLPTANVLTGFLCAFTVFTYMGHMAWVGGVEIHELPLAGPDLVFTAYPAALTLIPFSNFWSVLFFIMIFFLGIDSEFALLETVASHFEDEKLTFFGKKLPMEIVRLILTVALFVSGFILYTRAGFYYFPFYDTYSIDVPVTVNTAIECYVITWVYGWDKLGAMIQEHTGEIVPPYIVIMTKYACIPMLLFLAAGAILNQFVQLFSLPWWFAIIGFLLTALPLLQLWYNYSKYKDEPTVKDDAEKPLIELSDYHE